MLTSPASCYLWLCDNIYLLTYCVTPLYNPSLIDSTQNYIKHMHLFSKIEKVPFLFLKSCFLFFTITIAHAHILLLFCHSIWNHHIKHDILSSIFFTLVDATHFVIYLWWLTRWQWLCDWLQTSQVTVTSFFIPISTTHTYLCPQIRFRFNNIMTGNMTQL